MRAPGTSVSYQQETRMTLRPGGDSHRRTVQLLPIALLALALGTCLAYSKSTATAFTGLVWNADGGPFEVVRGDNLLSGSKGVTLLAGDMVETGPNAFLAIEAQEGTRIGIGPSTEVYFPQRTDITTLVVLKGWVKAAVKSDPLRVVGTRLGIQGHQSVFLLYASERYDAVFDEQGFATLLLREDTATRVGKEIQPNQFFRREDGTDVISQPRPSPEFVDRMPTPFWDNLPEPASHVDAVTPQLVRAVTYSDIQTWLTMPRDWRAGFIGRFRARIKDPAFFAAMDSHLALHPEWTPVLHPPPPPDPDRPGGLQPGGEQTQRRTR